jgi:hypothetical protein
MHERARSYLRRDDRPTSEDSRRHLWWAALELIERKAQDALTGHSWPGRAGP